MLEKLEQSIANSAEGKFALLNHNSYKLYELKQESWNRLAAAVANDDETVAAFVDGGQCALVKTPSCELHRIRTAVVIVESKKLASVKRKEGYLLATAAVEKDGLKYAAEFFESSLDANEKLEFAKGELAAAENEGTAIGKAAETARRISELAAAKWAVKELGKYGEGKQKLVVLDGTLETFSEREKEEMQLLIAEAKENNVLVAAVAKTCTILTDSGEPLIAAAGRISEGAGFVVAAAGTKEKHNAVIAVAKLNDSASYLFRAEAATEINNPITASGGVCNSWVVGPSLGKSYRPKGRGTNPSEESELKEALAALKQQSNDLAFPGYPYGLVMADKFARISNADLELTRSRLMATAGSRLKALMKQAKAMDAHSVLDRM